MIIIVGAGLAGVTSARILAEYGKKVLIVEKNMHLAGHCYDYRNKDGITIHKYGPHIFHTKEKKVWDYINKFTNFNYYQHKVLSYVEGKYINFPINRDTLVAIFGKTIGTNEVKDLLKEEIERSKFNKPIKNFRDAIVSQVGNRLYEMFFKNYTIKQWQKDPEELLPEIAKRIPIRENRDDRYFSDKYQGIPINGYTKMVEKMIDHPNISILMGEDYFNIKKFFDPELTVYTGALDEFFDCKYGNLEYRSLDLILKTIEKEYYQPVATINYPNDYDWTRITEYKHFLNEKSSKTTLCYEYPKNKGDPYYIVMTEDNMKKRELYMKEVEKLEKSRKFLFIGRLAEYKYYNMDQVVYESLNKVEKWV